MDGMLSEVMAHYFWLAISGYSGEENGHDGAGGACSGENRLGWADTMPSSMPLHREDDVALIGRRRGVSHHVPTPPVG